MTLKLNGKNFRWLKFYQIFSNNHKSIHKQNKVNNDDEKYKTKRKSLKETTNKIVYKDLRALFYYLLYKLFYVLFVLNDGWKTFLSILYIVLLRLFLSHII